MLLLLVVAVVASAEVKFRAGTGDWCAYDDSGVFCCTEDFDEYAQWTNDTWIAEHNIMIMSFSNGSSGNFTETDGSYDYSNYTESDGSYSSYTNSSYYDDHIEGSLYGFQCPYESSDDYYYDDFFDEWPEDKVESAFKLGRDLLIIVLSVALVTLICIVGWCIFCCKKCCCNKQQQQQQVIESFHF